MKIIFRKLKNVILVFLTILSLSMSLAPTAKAAVTTSWYNQSYKDWFLKVYSGNDSEIFGERYTAAQVQWILYSIKTQIVGYMLGGNYEVAVCLIGKDIGDCADMIENGFRDIISYDKNTPQSFLASITSNPASGIGYVSSLINKFKFIPEANAQTQAGTGFGFNAASPVLQVWKISRDISYGFIVLIVVVFAFMIMFRVKINPQTVITVQSALPKVVMSAILITFSYAIVGFLIDIMYVLMGLVAAIATQSSLFEMNFAQMIAALLNRNVFTIYLGYWFGFGITTLTTILSQNALYGFVMILIWIVLALILFIASFKGMFALLKNFAMLIIAIITGPLEILFGTLSSSGGFSAWIMKIISHLIVYPVVAVMVLLAHFFLAQGMPKFWGETLGIAGWLAFNPKWTFETNDWHVPFSAFEINGMRIVWIAVSYMLIIMIPKVLDIIKSFMEKKPYDYGTAIGEPTKSLWAQTGAPLVRGYQEHISKASASKTFNEADQVINRVRTFWGRVTNRGPRN